MICAVIFTISAAALATFATSFTPYATTSKLSYRHTVMIFTPSVANSLGHTPKLIL